MYYVKDAISLLENITKDIDYPLALLGEKLEILWLNDRAKQFFKNMKEFPTSLPKCAVGMKTAETVKLICSGHTCEFPVKRRDNKKIFVFSAGYSEHYMMLAAWLDADDNIRMIHERANIDVMVLQHVCKRAMQKMFNMTKRLAEDPVIEENDELVSAVDGIEREAYRMYLMLNDLQVAYRDRDNLVLESTRKFDFSEYFADLINATQVTLMALGANIKYSCKVSGKRYISANPTNFATTFLRLLKSAIMLCEGERNIRVSLTEEDNDLLLKIITKNTAIVDYIGEDKYKQGYLERGNDIERHYYAFTYNIAERLARRNNMPLTTTREGDTTTMCLRIPATQDPEGVLKSMHEVYLGNSFSTINMVFGDIL